VIESTPQLLSISACFGPMPLRSAIVSRTRHPPVPRDGAALHRAHVLDLAELLACQPDAHRADQGVRLRRIADKGYRR
jgi:hypothetical protein